MKDHVLEHTLGSTTGGIVALICHKLDQLILRLANVRKIIIATIKTAGTSANEWAAKSSQENWTGTEPLWLLGCFPSTAWQYSFALIYALLYLGHRLFLSDPR